MLIEIRTLYYLTFVIRHDIAFWADPSDMQISVKDITFSPNQLRKFFIENNIEY